ncbi:MAG: hypothetical protein ABIJ61_11685, partial [bacterium]
MKHRLGTILALLAFLLVGCDDCDCPTCPTDEPEPERGYEMLYSYVGMEDYWVYTYSTKTGEVLDSVRYGNYPFSDVIVSPDGQYGYYTVRSVDLEGGYATWVTDYADGDTLAFTGGLGGYSLALSKDGRFLATANARDLTIFEVPSLSVVFSGPDFQPGIADFHYERNVLYVPLREEDSLLVVDLRVDPPAASKCQLRGLGGGELHGLAVVYASAENMLVLRAAYFNRYTLQLLDADSLTAVAEMPAQLSEPYVHPDGRRVFFYTKWNEIGTVPATVWMLDVSTRVLRKLLSADGIGLPVEYFPGLSPFGFD